MSQIPSRSLRLNARPATYYQSFVGTAGEIFYDNTNQTLRVYPGNTAGGKILADRDWVNSNGVINYNNLNNKPVLFSGSYNDLTNKPVLFSGSYNDLTNKPNLFQFNIAADDSTQISISSDEVIKFIGAGGITTSSDAEGNITITQGSDIRSETDVNIEINLSDSTLQRWQFGEDGELTFPDGTAQSTAFTGFSNVAGIGFSRGIVVAEFSTDNTMTDNASDTVPVESAIRGYIDKRLGITHNDSLVPGANLIGPGYMPLNGLAAMTANLPMGSFKITGLGAPSANTDAATKGYVDSNIVSGAVVFKGTWNASTNTPTLVDGTGTNGWQYAVNVGGTRNLGSGSISFNAGDFVIYNGTVWQRIPASTIAEAGTLTGSTLNATVTASSLTSVGSLTSLTVAGITNLRQIVEVMSTKSGATGVVEHDFSTAAIFYHTSPAANFTINITNVPTTINRVITVSLIITQGGTGYYPNVLQIDSSAQTINWIGNVTPTPSVNRNDVVSFTLIRTAAPAWIVTGAMTGY